MCIIIVTEDGHIPKKHINHSLSYNDDGWGYMFSYENKLYVRKGMTAHEFWHDWKADRPFRSGRNVVFHARIATNGGVQLENNHPFQVGSRQLYMAHNGIISLHAKDKDKSDTKSFVDDVVAKLPRNWMDNEAVIAMMAEYIGFSKLAFMDNKGGYLIVNEDLGTWDNGRWYSNDTYKPTYSYNKTTSNTYGHKDDEFWCGIATCAVKGKHTHGNPPAWDDDYPLESQQQQEEIAWAEFEIENVWDGERYVERDKEEQKIMREMIDIGLLENFEFEEVRNEKIAKYKLDMAKNNLVKGTVVQMGFRPTGQQLLTK